MLLKPTRDLASQFCQATSPVFYTTLAVGYKEYTLPVWVDFQVGFRPREMPGLPPVARRLCDDEKRVHVHVYLL